MGMSEENRRLRRKVYDHPQWRRLKWHVKKRADFRCEDCGEGGKLEVHHVESIIEHPERAFDESNLRALCVSCHIRETRKAMQIRDTKPRVEEWRDLLKRPMGQN